jgi:prepilin-type N-terminal cleavage/methylation domain-containing protein
MMERSPSPMVGNRSQRGFSLAEVLVAVALLGVILLALFGLVTAGVRRAYGGKKMTQATMLAQAVMEQANVYEAYTLLGETDASSTAAITWTRTGSTVTPTTGPAAWRTMLAEADLPVSPSPTLTVSVTPLPAGTFANADIVRIQVDLTWYEFATRRRQVRLQALNLPKKP